MLDSLRFWLRIQPHGTALVAVTLCPIRSTHNLQIQRIYGNSRASRRRNRRHAERNRDRRRWHPHERAGILSGQSERTGG